jgi:hypothetical protein
MQPLLLAGVAHLHHRARKSSHRVAADTPTQQLPRLARRLSFMCGALFQIYICCAAVLVGADVTPGCRSALTSASAMKRVTWAPAPKSAFRYGGRA